MDEVRFCENNFQYDVEDVIDKLKEEYKDVNVEVESCLGQCDVCADGPFALVNDELVQADTADDLFEKIKALLE